ncbi:alpha/beta fold hydrolase [Haladaptatus sp. YSMS36]|uniref:alpha/beta fold hydrolase n=1 Tax=Haladaptatus sp. YSMS36 TaxID=3033384 RepID=UPI0023E76FED|nr:alpha/beta fold hydrolase [Haladaptatus sp. YSMS36]
MDVTTTDGTTLFAQAAGDGETVTFVGDAGYGAWQWGWQHAALTGPFETLVYDHRGVGRSEKPPGPYSVEQLVDDLEAVLSAHGARKTHLVGAGLGGMVALDYARRYARARTLTLVGTAAQGAGIDTSPLAADPTDEAAIRASLDHALSAGFVGAYGEVVDQIVQWRASDDATLAGWTAHQAAIGGFDADPLYEISLPTLVAHGTADEVWPAAGGEHLADGLPNATHCSLDGAGHLCHVEQSRILNDELIGFLEVA